MLNVSSSGHPSLVDVEDAINEARDFLRLSAMAGDGIKGDIGSAFVRGANSASDALMRALHHLGEVKKEGPRYA